MSIEQRVEDIRLGGGGGVIVCVCVCFSLWSSGEPLTPKKKKNLGQITTDNQFGTLDRTYSTFDI